MNTPPKNKDQYYAYLDYDLTLILVDLGNHNSN
jgi:hypothetical protein